MRRPNKQRGGAARTDHPGLLIGGLRVKRYVKLMLFLSSYAPLFAIFILRDVEPSAATIHVGRIEVPFVHLNLSSSVWLGLLMAAFAVVPSLVVASLLHVASREIGPEILIASKVVPKGAEVLNYIATYIIPFTTANLVKFGDIAALFLLFIVLATLYTKANLYYINPVLAFAGFRIFEVELSRDTGTVYIITRSQQLRGGMHIRGVNLTDNVFLEVGANAIDD